MQIEKGVPMPGGDMVEGRVAKAEAVIQRMEKGDSVVVPGKAHHVDASAFRAAARNIGVKVRTQTQPTTPATTRIWRMQ